MKTVRVRIAVAVDPAGEWNAVGWSRDELEEGPGLASEGVAEGERVYWVEAELEVPVVVQAESIEADKIEPAF